MIRLPFALWVASLLVSCSAKNQASGASSAPDGAISVDAGEEAGEDATADADDCGSVGCYVAADGTCDEYATPSPTQCPDIPSACANRGGTLSRPAACPATGFLGKCTIGTAGVDGVVTRYYAPADAAAMQSFCTGIAQGTWSTVY